MKLQTLILFSFLCSCTSKPKSEIPVTCHENWIIEDLELVTSQEDSVVQISIPKSWFTEFSINENGYRIYSSDTSQDLEKSIIVAKNSFNFKPSDFNLFRQTAISFLAKNQNIDIIDSGVFKLDNNEISWYKYSEHNEIKLGRSINLEFIYPSIYNVASFKITVFGKDKIEERICEGFHLFTVNK